MLVLGGCIYACSPFVPTNDSMIRPSGGPGSCSHGHRRPGLQGKLVNYLKLAVEKKTNSRSYNDETFWHGVFFSVFNDLPHPETNRHRPWKWMIGILGHPFEARPIFRGFLLLVLGRVSEPFLVVWNHFRGNTSLMRFFHWFGMGVESVWFIFSTLVFVSKIRRFWGSEFQNIDLVLAYFF